MSGPSFPLLLRKGGQSRIDLLLLDLRAVPGYLHMPFPCVGI